jgi:hypothetical protein
LGEGLEVYVASESCGLGSGLYRSQIQAGAHCYVIAAQQLDERNTRVKTGGRDARELCLPLDRYLAGNKDFLAVRVPSEEEERARHWAASVSSLSVIDRKWMLRAAVCLSIMVGRRRRAGGGHKAGTVWASFCRFGCCPTLKFVGRCSWPSISESAR